MTDRLAYWFAHPHIRRVSVVIAMVHGLAVWAVCAAPTAAASAGEALLGWTGLRDSYGVPMSAYFVSLVSTPEATLNNGQDVSVLDPTTWVKWMGQAMETAVTHSTAAWWLTLTTSCYVFLVGVSLWLVRFALSTQWLVVIAQIARPVYNAVTTVAGWLYLGPITVTLCVMIGGFHILRGHRGRGWALIGTGVLFTVLLVTVFADPIGELYSEHGLLAMGRETGFAIAQATRGNPYAPGQPLEAQLNALVGELITSAVRQPLQVINFGMVVDDAPGCAAQWSAAIVNGGGSGPGPAHAMGPVSEGGCGAVTAMAHAQQLGGGDFLTALIFLGAGAVLSVFLWYVAITNFLVGLKAAYFGTVVGPAFMVGMTGLADRAMAYAKHSGWQLLIHAVELAVYTAFLGIVMVWIGFALTTPALGHGTFSVVPRMLIVMLAAIVALLLFRFIERQFHSDGIGTISHTVRDAFGTVRQAGRDRYDETRARVDNARQTAGRLRSRFSRGDRGTTGKGEEDTSTTASQAPGFDTFSKRPQSSRTTKKWVSERLLTRRTAPAAAEGAESAASSAVASGAARAGAARAATGVVADVAAPEVAIPAAVGAHVVHKHREKAQRRREAESAERTAQASPGARPDNRDRADRDQRPTTNPDSAASQDTFSPRPSWRAHRSTDSDSNRGRDVEPTGYEAPPIERQPRPDPRPSESPALDLGTRESTQRKGKQP